MSGRTRSPRAHHAPSHCSLRVSSSPRLARPNATSSRAVSTGSVLTLRASQDQIPLLHTNISPFSSERPQPELCRYLTHGIFARCRIFRSGMDPKDVEILKRQLKIGGRMIAPVGVGVQVLLQFDRVGKSTGRLSGLPPPLQALQTPESTCNNITKHFPTHPRNGT